MEWLGLCAGLLWVGLFAGLYLRERKNPKPLFMPVPLSGLERRAQSEQILEAVRYNTTRDVFLPIPLEFRAAFVEPDRADSAMAAIGTIYDDARMRIERDDSGAVLFVVKDLPLELEGIVAFENDVAGIVNKLLGHYAGWWEWTGDESVLEEE